MMLAGKHIVVGISGGIAAYKIPELIRLLKKQGAEVRVTTTRHALEFVTELTLQTLSGARVYSDVFAAINEHATEHISLPEWADAMIVAPATANVIGKFAAGIADDALTTTFAAMRKPVVIAPAMNDKMYQNPATQRAMQTLAATDNILLMDAESGFLACGSEGKGRMAEIDKLVEALHYRLTPKTLTGKRILITAGPTQEKIDPVRFISNYSTGKMGFALARACYNRGATVQLIAGPVTQALPEAFPSLTPTATIETIRVTSALEMARAAEECWPKADAAILCAAVADFMPAQCANEKIKRSKDEMVLHLSPTRDIAAALGTEKRPGQCLVGFALETQNEQTHAQDKLRRKNLDMIVLNSLRDAGAGFGTDTNKVTLLFPDNTAKESPLQTKEAVAETIVSEMTRLMNV